MRTLVKFGIGVVLIVLAFLGYRAVNNTGLHSIDIDDNQVYIVEKVVDGDTIKVSDIESGELIDIRYLGIDAPEFKGPNYETCFGEEAKARNGELVENKRVIIELDKDNYDRFGRVLAYVYTIDKRGGKDVFVNKKLLEEGYARFYLDKENTLYQDELVEVAGEAYDNFEGLWGVCGEVNFQNKCMIKGNVDRMGNKYYHLPGDKYYSLTKVNLIKEDEWLCAIDEAEDRNFKRVLK